MASPFLKVRGGGHFSISTYQSTKLEKGFESDLVEPLNILSMVVP